MVVCGACGVMVPQGRVWLHGLEALRPHQYDVRVPVHEKLNALRAVFDLFRTAGYSFVTLREAAEAFS